MKSNKRWLKFCNEIRQISWGVEIIKTAITTLFISVFTVSFLCIIKYLSPGDYYGPRLENEFKSMLCKEISPEAKIQEFKYVYIGELSAIDNKKLLSVQVSIMKKMK